jgi:ABC-type multidrug transport system fused ATPase/permease subunit
MRTHQPGSYGSARGATRNDVEDWSWRRTMRRAGLLLTLATPYKWRALLAVLFLLLATAATLTLPLLAKFAIDEAIGEADPGKLGTIVGVFVGAAVLAWIATAGHTYYTSWVGERVLADLRSRLFRHLQSLSLGYFERRRTGATISRLTNDVDALDQLVTDGVASLVQNSIVLVGSAAILLVLDWRLALATLAVFPLMAISTAIFRRLSARAYRSVRERIGSVSATLQEDISGMRVVQAFAREDQSRDQFVEVNDRYRAANQRTVVISGLYFPFVDFVAAVASAVVLGYGGYLVFGNSLTIGTLFAFIGYLANFFDPVQQLSQLYNTFLAAVAALDKITDVLDEKPDVLDRPDASELATIQGDVRFDNITFGYGEGPTVLHGLDLAVPAGTTVALVGHTGAGKSTIVKLLARFYDPRDGRVLIDDVDLRSIEQKSLRTQLGIVPQEGFLFGASVGENIAFGQPEATQDEIEDVARQVGVHEFIETLPEGYDTRVGERGSLLSLGQRQLVAFARALLADPRILILDEATSSVDIATEQRIDQALNRLLDGRTAFVIAHRLSTIRRADLIVVLENGRVVERGTHADLMESDGPYASLYGAWAEVA